MLNKNAVKQGPRTPLGTKRSPRAKFFRWNKLFSISATIVSQTRPQGARLSLGFPERTLRKTGIAI